MYLDKPLRDHNLLQAIARTNRPLPAMKKRTGVVVDYFGVFTNLEKALNFDESVREESLIDWDALRATVPGEVARCMELFDGIAIADTRECLLAALRRLRDPEAAKNFEHNFRSLERLWEAVAPDPVPVSAPSPVQLAVRHLRRPPAPAARAARTPTASCRPRPASSSRRTRRSSTSRSRCRSSRSTRTTSPSSTSCRRRPTRRRRSRPS